MVSPKGPISVESGDVCLEEQDKIEPDRKYLITNLSSGDRYTVAGEMFELYIEGKQDLLLTSIASRLRQRPG